MIIVGDCCATEADPRFMEEGETWSRRRRADGELRLGPGQLTVLRAMNDGLVYRHASKVLVLSAAGAIPRSTDRQVNSTAYDLIGFGLAHWLDGVARPPVVLPNGSETINPRAWAVPNEDGMAYLCNFEKERTERSNR